MIDNNLLNRYTSELLNKYQWTRVYKRGQTRGAYYEYNKARGTWSKVPTWSIKEKIAQYLDQVDDYSATLARELYAFMKYEMKSYNWSEVFGVEPPLKFNFANGVFDWDEMKLRERDSTAFFTTVTDYSLELNRTAPATNQYFEMVFGENAQTVKEYIGYSFYPSFRPIQALMFFKAEGQGKTTLLNYINSLAGDGGASSVCLRSLKRGHQLKQLVNRYINTSDVFGGGYLYTGYLKLLTDNDRMNVDNERVKNYAKLFFAANKLPKLYNTSHGWGRRAFVIDLKQVENFNNIIDLNKVYQERGAFVGECLKLAKKAIERKSLTVTDSIENNRKAWLKSTSESRLNSFYV